MIRKINAVLLGAISGIIQWPIICLAISLGLEEFAENEGSLFMYFLSIFSIPFLLPVSMYYCISKNLKEVET
ncbi:MAG: hypothetical protein ABEJ02_03025 [Candidatus Paceibacteria bacterium]